MDAREREFKVIGSPELVDLLAQRALSDDDDFRFCGGRIMAMDFVRWSNTEWEVDIGVRMPDPTVERVPWALPGWAIGR